MSWRRMHQRFSIGYRRAASDGPTQTGVCRMYVAPNSESKRITNSACSPVRQLRVDGATYRSLRSHAGLRFAAITFRVDRRATRVGYCRVVWPHVLLGEAVA